MNIPNIKEFTFIPIFLFFILSPEFALKSQQLDERKYDSENDPTLDNAVGSEYQFNGYTNY